jgi:putative PIN family toxin of toxin-antitoxin system
VRVVADTNTIVSALLWQGSPHRLVAAIEDYPIAFYTSRALLDELAEVLTRRKLANAVNATGKTAARLVAEYAGFVNLVTPALIHRVAHDPDDDAVLACALAARADLIISGDAHLLNLKSYQRIPIVAAAEALARVRQVSAGN